ncbi:MAG: AAA family ATPase [Archaeoglobaceae archaeon]
MEDYLWDEVVVKKSTSPVFTLNGEQIDLWSDEYLKYHSTTVTDYIRKSLLSYEKEGLDPFHEIIGKEGEKDSLKNALMSGSSILFKGMRGYGKTTFSKSIVKLLPQKQLAIQGCKINDDPLNPVCFSCKKKVVEDDEVELTWIPQKWIRISGDPMMTTRQLIGGISIQKLKEGYDLDHPEVFNPGRILRAHRGIGYFDELGAVPSALQTLLHELLEEKQITTLEGDLLPMKIDTVFIASTNPANYRGTADIKEPLLDRLEEIPIGPPGSLQEEIEVGLKNMSLKMGAFLPSWHLKILARAVRCARQKDGCGARLESEPSCRATIKLFDHLRAAATRRRHEAAMLTDYGENYGVIKLGLRSRIEPEFGEESSKEEIIQKLVEEAINQTCSEIYSVIPEEDFGGIMEEVSLMSDNGINAEDERDFKEYPHCWKFLILMAQSPHEVKSAFEIMLESIKRCTNLIEKTELGIYTCIGYEQ